MFADMQLLSPPSGSDSNILAAIEEGRTELWRHPGQAGATHVLGYDIRAYFRAQPDLLVGCADERDLLVIQAKPALYQKYFSGQAIFAWRGAGEHVPFLFELGTKVVLSEMWVGDRWFWSQPALRRKWG